MKTVNRKWKDLKMQKSDILSQTVIIENINYKAATHFALCNGSQLRYLIDLCGGKKRLSKNISSYSKKLGLLMQLMNIMPFSLMRWLKLGHYVKAELHNEVEACRQSTQKKHWNMIIGTYDEKQKVVLQCFNDVGAADFVKIGNAATEEEMNAEISFLRKKMQYSSFKIPDLVSSSRRTEGAAFNIQVTKEFTGNKVEPVLTQEIVNIYRELSTDMKDGLAFSHGDFAPWNLKKNGEQYTLFDWEHCGYRMPGFDLMHYAEIIEVVINGKGFSEAFESGLENIRKYLPDFSINKDKFLDEFRKLRKQIVW